MLTNKIFNASALFSDAESMFSSVELKFSSVEYKFSSTEHNFLHCKNTIPTHPFFSCFFRTNSHNQKVLKNLKVS